MGQRTQIIIQTESNAGARNTSVYHFQWGFGRVMFLQLFGILLQDYFKDTFTPGYAFGADIQMIGKGRDLSDEFTPEERESLNKLEFDNPRAVGDVLRSCDNNNGGLFVRIKEDKTAYHAAAISFAFMPGYEEGGNYDRFCTAKEYANFTPSYSDPDFYNLFDSFCKYFNLVDMAAKPRPEDK